MSLLFLPAYSPELQLAEHLWQLSDQPLLNRRFHSLADLEDTQAKRCHWIQARPDLDHPNNNFLWRPQLR